MLIRRRVILQFEVGHPVIQRLIVVALPLAQSGHLLQERSIAGFDLQQLLPHTPGAVLIAKRQAQAELLA